jgi:pseudaminic acid cytidylyltransferase
MIAIIPARGGSKRIKKKNIRAFNGLPILVYSIKTAQNSNCFSQVFVSTEDEEIAKVAQAYGATVIRRPKELADDYTPTKSVIRHAIKSMSISKPVCCLSALAPLLSVSTLRNACDKLNDDDFVFDCKLLETVTPVQRCLEIIDGKTKMLLPKYANTRTQDLRSVYFHTGQFCVATVDTWLNDNITTLEGTPYVVSDAVDIDTEEDWQRAEKLYEIFKSQKGGV